MRHSSGSSVREGSIAGRSAELDLPLGLVGGEHPDLARRPGLDGRSLRQRDRLRAAFDPRVDAHGVAPAAHLHADRVLLDARRQIARDRDGHRPRQQRSRERDLARAARHLELEARLDEERDAVADQAEHLDAKALALAVRLDAGAQPQQAGRVAPRPRHRLAVEAQVHERDLGGQAQRLGQARPGEAAAQPVAARRGAHARSAVLVEDGSGGAVEPHVLGPGLRAARQSHVDGSVGQEIERERPAGGPELELQPAGPEADGLSLHGRAAERRHLVEHPRHPRAEGGRQVVLGEGLGTRTRHKAGERYGERQSLHDQQLEASHGHLPQGAGCGRPAPVTAEGYGLFPRGRWRRPIQRVFGERPGLAGVGAAGRDPRSGYSRMTIR